MLCLKANNCPFTSCLQATKFEEVWDECRKICLPTAAAEERRHSDVAYASEVLSIPNLVRRATENLKAQVM